MTEQRNPFTFAGPFANEGTYRETTIIAHVPGNRLRVRREARQRAKRRDLFLMCFLGGIMIGIGLVSLTPWVIAFADAFAR